MDLEYADKIWSLGKIRSLVHGSQRPDDEAWDGWADVGNSYYALRRKALDMGRVEDIHDCIQLEQAIEGIEDEEVQAALVLRLNGWAPERIGAVLKSRRTGRQLLHRGVHMIKSSEELKRF